MASRKPALANVVTGAFAGGVTLPEPDWMVAFPRDAWATEAASLAHDKWLSVTAHMQLARTLGPENVTAIEILAISYARWRLAEAHVAEHGPVVAAPRTSDPMPNPYLAVANGAAERVLKIEAELGLPPTARSKAIRVGAAPSARPR